MAQITVGMGAPHTPYFPRMAREDPGADIVTHFNTLREGLEGARPDLLLVYTSDHLVNFFFDKMPTFSIGTAEHADGPHELSRDMPWYDTTVAGSIGKDLHRFGVARDFDLAGAEEFLLDHATLVPLHFLTPAMDIPILPIFINGLAHPLPNAARCYQLGQMVREFLDQQPDSLRVGVIASGSFSLEVGGPQMGWIDQDWVRTAVELIGQAQGEELVRASTTEQLVRAGNTGGEILNWIATLGTLGAVRPSYIQSNVEPDDDPRDAHAFALWELEQP